MPPIGKAITPAEKERAERGNPYVIIKAPAKPPRVSRKKPSQPGRS